MEWPWWEAATAISRRGRLQGPVHLCLGSHQPNPLPARSQPRRYRGASSQRPIHPCSHGPAWVQPRALSKCQTRRPWAQNFLLPRVRLPPGGCGLSRVKIRDRRGGGRPIRPQVEQRDQAVIPAASATSSSALPSPPPSRATSSIFPKPLSAATAAHTASQSQEGALE